MYVSHLSHTLPIIDILYITAKAMEQFEEWGYHE